MKKHLIFSVLLTGIILLSLSCAKGPGEGGKASIWGKLTIVNYDATFTTMLASYPAQAENVYIIYGDDKTFGKSVKTNYDGTYEFPYLRKGMYTIVAYSKDTNKYLNGVISQAGQVVTSKTVAVIQKVEISDRKQVVQARDTILIK